MKYLVMNTEDTIVNRSGVFQIARKLLNRALVSKIFQKKGYDTPW
jgi:hypothetical protein